MEVKDKEVQVIIKDLGITDYNDTLAIQRDIFGQLVENKKNKIRNYKNYLLLTEHLPVITLGRHADHNNVLLDDSRLKSIGVNKIEIERGGDVTFHGPGQLVVYPLIDLDEFNIGIKDYVRLIEETVILALRQSGIEGMRKAGAPGVWINIEGPEKKICALGIKSSRFCVMHGFALNINTDLSGFMMINPCGFKDYGVTSIKEITGENQSIDKIKKIVSDIFLSLIFSFKK